MNLHKDLPSGSQSWAKEVDALMETVKRQDEIIRRLAANAGIDYSNPQRGLNSGDTPSVNNPVGQKLSSLADVQIYNVADGQGLNWSQKDQRWLPVTPSAGGTIDISGVSYSQLEQGYGLVTDSTHYSYTAAGLTTPDFGPGFYYTESWTTGAQYIGAGNWDVGPSYAMIELNTDGFGRPYISLTASDYVDGTDAYITMGSYFTRINTKRVRMPYCTTANRPAGLSDISDDVGSLVYDTTLGIPVWWNGTAWTDSLGTAV